MTGNGTEQLKGPPFRLDRQTGEVVIIDRAGAEHRLKPTMSAGEQIETRFSAGLNVIRTRVAAACWPYTPAVAAEPKMIPTSAELATILQIGMKEGGDRGATLEGAKKIIWDMGVDKVAPALFEFLWAATDGGRLREEDLKNEDSPSGSKPEPNGVDTTVEEQLTAELTAGLHSGGSLE